MMNPTYTKKIVALIDILGFRDLLKNRDNLKVLVEQLANMRKTFNSDVFPRDFDKLFKYEIKQVSDSIIVSVDIKDTFELSLFLEKLGEHIGESFIENEIVVRGAITYGDFFSDGDFLVSPAVVEAYDLEKGAKYPRIVISEKIFELINNSTPVSQKAAAESWFGRFYRTSADGVKFLDYLHFTSMLERPSPQQFMDPYAGMQERLDRFNRHKKLIEDKLKQFKTVPAVFEKYIWLAHYHNNFVTTIQDDSLKTCVIDEKLLNHF